MKKIGKVLLLSSLTVATVGTIALTNIGPETLQKPETKTDIQAYNHNPNTVLDNVFEKDGKMILPFIFKDSDQTITKTYLAEQFRKANHTIQNLSSLKDIIVTGDEIKTENTTYTVWIYGDVNSDGYVDVFDAQRALRHFVLEDKYTLNGNNAVVANVYNKDNEIDVFDAQRILKFFVGLEPKLVLIEPLSTIEQNIEYPRITLKGNDPQYVRLGGTYEEAGATVSDNKDKNLTVQIDSKEVDTSKIGTYYVSYKAVDSDGYERIVRREVKVRDYVTDLNVTGAPKTVNYGKELDLSSMQVTAKMKSSGDTPVSLNASQYKVAGYNSEKLGPQTITVTYESEDGTFEGKQATFSVEVKDYQTGIEVEFPKTEYKYQEDLDFTGAQVRTKMASGAFGKWEPITEDMVWGYDKEQTIKQTLRITYSDVTEEIEVEVKDYAIDMNITSYPTNQEHQKYGKELDLSGMIVNATMAKGNRVITVTDYEVKGYNPELLGPQTITIVYAGYEKPLTVIVENYITGIELKAASGAQKLYVEGEKFNYKGLELHKIMAVKEEGFDTSIPMDDSDLLIVPIGEAFLGATRIEFIYTTKHTETGKSKEYVAYHDITVLKHLETVSVKPQKTDAYAHEEFIFGTILSGTGEEILQKENVKAHIVDHEGNPVASDKMTMKLEPIGEGIESEIQVYFTFEEKDDYKVTFYVGDNFEDSTIRSQTQLIHVDYNPIIISANIKKPNETSFSVREEKSIERAITFTNKHGDTLTEVLASSVEFTESNDNVSFTKMTAGHPVTSDKDMIDTVRITGRNAGTTVIRMIVNKGTKEEDTILLGPAAIGQPAKKNIYLEGSPTNIRLYQEKPLENEKIDLVLPCEDVVYTLIPIHIVDEDGDEVLLKGSDRILGDPTKEKKLGVQYTDFNANRPLLKVALFADKIPGSKPITSDEEVHYLGIALEDGVGSESLLDRNLMIHYYNEKDKVPEIPILVEPMRIKELIITPQNVSDRTGLPTGKDYEEFLVGKVESGPRQRNVEVDDFYTLASEGQSIPNYQVFQVFEEENNRQEEVTNSTNDKNEKIVDIRFGYDNTEKVGKVEILATARQEGTYIVKCWVTVAGKNIEQTQKFKTEKDSEVVGVNIIDLDKITVGTPVAKDIEFVNKYDEVIDVEYSDIQYTKTNIEKVQFRNADNAPTGTVRNIQILSNTVGEASLTIKVKEKILPTINFTVVAAKPVIDVTGLEMKDEKYVIRLYENNPNDSTKAVSGPSGYMYTLIPIRIQENGNTTVLKGKQYALREPGDNRDLGTVPAPSDPSIQLPYTQKVVVSYSGEDTDLLAVSMFKADKTPQLNDEDATYLGIALFDETEDTMIGKTITLTYGTAEPITITVIPSTT